MARKKYYMVIDTETCGDYVFDVGYRVIDRAGKCYAHASFVVAEFINCPERLGMFTDRFTRDKIGKYYFDLWANNGGFKVVPFVDVRDNVREVIRDYNAIVCAYNIAFDLTHLEKTAQYLGYDGFFNGNIETIDIWNVAMCILGTKKYIRFCMANEFYTKTGNIQTGAEIMFRYITNDATFNEAHTAHEDCIIECAILEKCFKQKKHFETKTVNPCLHNAAWRSIQETHKSMC